jgi:hypothetical protein
VLSALPATQFVAGWNLPAVEVHQSSTNSSDLSFDLALTAAPPPPATQGKPIRATVLTRDAPPCRAEVKNADGQ